MNQVAIHSSRTDFLGIDDKDAVMSLRRNVRTETAFSNVRGADRG